MWGWTGKQRLVSIPVREDAHSLSAKQRVGCSNRSRRASFFLFVSTTCGLDVSGLTLVFGLCLHIVCILSRRVTEKEGRFATAFPVRKEGDEKHLGGALGGKSGFSEGRGHRLRLANYLDKRYIPPITHDVVLPANRQFFMP